MLCVFLALGCGGGGSGTVSRIDHRVKIANDDTYSPQTINARVGEVIRWRNIDSESHTIKATDVPGLNSDIMYPEGIPPGGTWEYKVPLTTPPGTRFEYRCRFHGAREGSTVGTIIVQ